MLIAGPVVCRESAGAHAKSNMFLFSSTMSCFQGGHLSGDGVILLLSCGAGHINTFKRRMFCLNVNHDPKTCRQQYDMKKKNSERSFSVFRWPLLSIGVCNSGLFVRIECN